MSEYINVEEPCLKKLIHLGGDPVVDQIIKAV